MPKAAALRPAQATAIRRILLAVDGFAPDPDAAAWAGLLAQRFGAAVDAVAAVPKPTGLLRLGSRLDSAGGMRSGLERLDAAAAGNLHGLAALPAMQGVSLQSHVEHGEPTQALLSAERRLRPDLVVVGPQGSATLHTRLGSVADYVKHYAAHSVLIAKAPPLPVQGIAVGTDGSENAARAVAVATALAQQLACPLEVVEARTPGSPNFDTREEEALERMRRHFPAARRLPGSRFVLSNLPAAAVLLDAATRSTLVVVGSRGLGPLTGLMLGSVSDKVARESAASVLVVR